MNMNTKTTNEKTVLKFNCDKVTGMIDAINKLAAMAENGYKAMWISLNPEAMYYEVISEIPDKGEVIYGNEYYEFYETHPELPTEYIFYIKDMIKILLQDLGDMFEEVNVV